jgi:hypothetical protein
LSPTSHLLGLAIHHTACDASGLYFALDDLARAYSARARGERLPVLPLRYGEYARWQAKRMEGRFDADLAFWTEHLASVTPYAFRSDFPFRPGNPEPHAAELRVELLDGEGAQALRRFAQRHRATPFVVLSTAFQLALSCRTEGRDRLTVTYFDQREHPGVRGMIGVFLRAAAVRISLPPEASVAQLLREATQSTLASYARAHVPATLVAATTPAVVPSLVGEAPPWCLFMHFIPQAASVEYRLGEALGRVCRASAVTRQEPGLSLRVSQRPGGEWVSRWGFDTRLFRRESLEALARAVKAALASMMREPQRAVAAVERQLPSW